MPNTMTSLMLGADDFLHATGLIHMPVMGVGHDTGIDFEQLLLEPGNDVGELG